MPYLHVFLMDPQEWDARRMLIRYQFVVPRPDATHRPRFVGISRLSVRCLALFGDQQGGPCQSNFGKISIYFFCFGKPSLVPCLDLLAGSMLSGSIPPDSRYTVQLFRVQLLLGNGCNDDEVAETTASARCSKLGKTGS